MLQFIVPAAAGLLGAGLSYHGQQQANVANARMAREQMAFQERMSNTAYQRAVADMRAAGLNPALAYQQGGANAPVGQSAVMQNAMGAAATGAQAVASTMQAAAQTSQIRLESVARLEEIIARVGATRASGAATQAGQRLTEEQTRGQIQANRLAEDTRELRIELIRQEIQNLITQAREGSARSKHLELDLPRAANMSRAQGTWWKKYISPFMHDAQGLKRTVFH